MPRGSSSSSSSAPEPVFVVEPRTPAEWGAVRVSHRQQPSAGDDHRATAIVCPDAPGHGAGARAARAFRSARGDAAPFTPVGLLTATIGTDVRRHERSDRQLLSRCCTSATACFRSARSRIPTASKRRRRRARSATAATSREWLDALPRRSASAACDGPAVLLAWAALRDAATGTAVARSTTSVTRCGRRRRRATPSRAMGARLLKTWQAAASAIRARARCSRRRRRPARSDAAGRVRRRLRVRAASTPARRARRLRLHAAGGDRVGGDAADADRSARGASARSPTRSSEVPAAVDGVLARRERRRDRSRRPSTSRR